MSGKGQTLSFSAWMNHNGTSCFSVNLLVFVADNGRVRETILQVLPLSICFSQVTFKSSLKKPRQNQRILWVSESPHTQLHRVHVPRHQWLNGIEIIMRCNECYCRKEIPWNVDLRQVTGGNVKDEKRYKCIESQINISHHITSNVIPIAHHVYSYVMYCRKLIYNSKLHRLFRIYSTYLKH